MDGRYSQETALTVVHTQKGFTVNKKDHLDAISKAKSDLANAEAAYIAFQASPEQNVFASMEEAEGVLEDRLRDQAYEDCQGAYNCGADTYVQDFSVEGKSYRFTLTCEYNRHDKTYYYIEESSYKIEEI